MRVLQTMENPRHHGSITALCIDRKRAWIVVGTSTGVLTLWDKRFGLLLRSWYVGVTVSGRSARIHQCVVHPTKGRGKWIMVTVNTSKKPTDRAYSNLVEVWDIENAVLVETFVMRVGSPSDPIPEPHEMTGVDAEPSPAAAIAALVRSQNSGNSESVARQPSRNTFSDELIPSPAPDVRALVVGLDFGGYSMAHRSEYGEMIADSSPSGRSATRGFMITGSEDRKIRLWDLGKLERTTILSGLESENEKPSYE